MDVFGTAVTALHEIYNITMFIRRVVADMDGYASSKQEIHDKLEHEFLFMATFKNLFFEDMMRDDRIPLDLKRDVANILRALKKSLADYELLATKHGLLENHSVQSDGDDGTREQPVPVASKGDNNSATLENTPSVSLTQRLKRKVTSLRKTGEWALFDKESITKVLAEYGEWTGRLRQTTSLFLLVMSTLGGLSKQDLAKSKTVEGVGLHDVLARQMLSEARAPADFLQLPGAVTEDEDDSEVYSSITIGKYDNGWGVVRDVVVEYREYDPDLTAATIKRDEKDMSRLKEPTLDLAWLLHRGPFSNRRDEVAATNRAQGDQLAIYALHCLGYMDDQDARQMMLVYEIPKTLSMQRGSSIVPLHNWINADAKLAMPKPVLGARFFMAHTLCLTLLNIHASGWLHKNIRSHGIVVFPREKLEPGSQSPDFVPYLAGWDAARTIDGHTRLASDSDVESNFYRHPVRHGKPSEPFNVSHDIYSLGVVLLELALWKTVSSLFREQIATARRGKFLHPPMDVLNALLSKARADVAVEMGEAYARVVEWCLSGAVLSGEGRMAGAQLSAEFGRKVMDVIAGGLKL